MTKKHTNITIDGRTVNNDSGTVYRGLGTVTGNNSSRLLMDYKVKNPKAYWEIMNLLFKPDYGAGLTHVKLEFGADINSSSGTEPSIMRYADEKADVTRGAGFMFAADALTINPEITVDLLRWGEPAWVAEEFKKSQEQGFDARYKWYKSALDAAYETYGIKFTHVSPDSNETGTIDTEWLIYFSERLKAETNCRYDYSDIKIVASDEVGTWQIADEMMKNERLRNAVDILGEHYNTHASENALLLNKKYGKEIWYTEGIASSNIARLAVNNDGVGIIGTNGALDVCNRIINGYYNGRMTMYEYQPSAAAYYSGVSYFPKGLLTANTPWSGFYDVDSGVWLSAHFTRFIKNGWRFVDSGCFGDGKENHFISETTNNYMTVTDPDTGDYTIIICNDSPETRCYNFSFENMAKASSPVDIWETRGPDKGQDFKANYLKYLGTFFPEKLNGKFNLYTEVSPYSLVTITTVDKKSCEPIFICGQRDVPLDVNYSDDFDYSDIFLGARGNAPLYTTDYGGAFEIGTVDGEKVLMQMIGKDIKPVNWRFRGTPNPITTLGDDRWCNYSAEIEFRLESPAEDNYAALGVRYLTSDLASETAENGYAVTVFTNGKWELRKNGSAVISGTLNGFDSTAWHSIRLTAAERNITAEIDGKIAAEFTDKEAYPHSGRVSIGSGLYKNIFRKFRTARLTGFAPVIKRLDDHDAAIVYGGEWERKIAQGYIHFNRTLSKSVFESYFEFEFEGSGFAVIGETEEAEIEVYDNGKLVESAGVQKALPRQCSYSKSLAKGKHSIRLAVRSGSLTVDAVEYC
ncbi:MAG: glycosyl hydrolase family 59 [Oscillospiraceae bacterium]|nr:glycosyl hydrolase family 59 [Oscillospiraceae bacterium]